MGDGEVGGGEVDTRLCAPVVIEDWPLARPARRVAGVAHCYAHNADGQRRVPHRTHATPHHTIPAQATHPTPTLPAQTFTPPHSIPLIPPLPLPSHSTPPQPTRSHPISPHRISSHPAQTHSNPVCPISLKQTGPDEYSALTRFYSTLPSHASNHARSDSILSMASDLPESGPDGK